MIIALNFILMLANIFYLISLPSVGVYWVAPFNLLAAVMCGITVYIHAFK